MLLFIAVVSCVGVQVFAFPPYSNDVYLRMALERQKEAAYPASWYDNPYDDYGYSAYDYASPQRSAGDVAGLIPDSGQREDSRSVVTDMEVDPYWPSVDVTMGQVSGVAVDANDNPVVFHRADHPWDPQYQLFDDDNNFLATKAGPIQQPTILTLNKEDGSLLNARGSSRFYVPHGITFDGEDNIWVTDVALHQVFKFKPGVEAPDLVLGKQFEPAKDNNDKERFCKPTDVAVARTGHIFVADGYCNSRVVRFSADGKYEAQFGDSDFVVPHSLALAEDLDLICVADREDKRILCYNAGLQDERLFGRLEREYTDPMESKIYAVEYNPQTGLLFAVNAPTYDSQGTGYTIDLTELTYTADIIDVWSPFNNGFTAAHDVTVSHDGSAIYVGEITLRDINLWKFNDVANILEGNDINQQKQAEVKEPENGDSIEAEGKTEEVEDDEVDDEAEYADDADNKANKERGEIDDTDENDSFEEDQDESLEKVVQANPIEQDKSKIVESKEDDNEHDIATEERLVDSGAAAATM